MQKGYSDNYLEDKVLSASPLELVRLLYRGAVEATGEARRALREGDITARGRAVGKAEAIVGELAQSLRPVEGAAELHANLQQLYAYVLAELARGHYEQSDAALANAERLLATLEEGWRAAVNEPAAPPRLTAPVAHRPLSVSA